MLPAGGQQVTNSFIHLFTHDSFIYLLLESCRGSVIADPHRVWTSCLLGVGAAVCEPEALTYLSLLNTHKHPAEEVHLAEPGNLKERKNAYVDLQEGFPEMVAFELKDE